MKKILMYDKYDETYREVIDVKELKRYIEEKIKKLDETRKKDVVYLGRDWFNYEHKIYALQSLLKDLEVEDD